MSDPLTYRKLSYFLLGMALAAACDRNYLLAFWLLAGALIAGDQG